MTASLNVRGRIDRDHMTPGMAQCMREDSRTRHSHTATAMCSSLPSFSCLPAGSSDKLPTCLTGPRNDLLPGMLRTIVLSSWWQMQGGVWFGLPGSPYSG